MFSESDLEAYLYRQIPLSRAMGVRVCKASVEEVRLRIPLDPNLNHLQTLFGGSGSAAAILASWAHLSLRLRDHCLKPELVIQANQLHYLKPIHGDCEAVSEPLDEAAWAPLHEEPGEEGVGEDRLPVVSGLERGTLLRVLRYVCGPWGNLS